MDMKNIKSAFYNKSAVETKAQKGTYYRPMANQKMDWRNLLFCS
jgi:hypothetical protein